MKKLLLTTAAVAGLVAVAAPAKAEGLELGLKGYTRAYVAYVDQDTTTGTEERSLDILRDSEIAFTGEATLDNGLTVGAYIEAEADSTETSGDSFKIDENYVYFAGSWGRVNVGSEDGAAYLLQVAAPSADSAVDGIRQQIQGVNYGLTGIATGHAGGLDYDNDIANADEKVTYLTPVFSGFQAGLTYTPEVARPTTGSSAVVAQDDQSAGANYGDSFEVAFRWEGQFDELGVTLGAGFASAELEATQAGFDDREAWDAGVDFDWGPFGLGVAYLHDDQGEDDHDQETLVVGADYVTGPFKLGASYMNKDEETGTGANEIETDRYTGGVVYTFGPGMTFRGSVSYIETEQGTTEVESTNLLLGTQIKF
ncbi:MAG: porin [Alphaproteobacteria bacterium]|nr:porin [Alphaproteobacteria bacterium]